MAAILELLQQSNLESSRQDEKFKRGEAFVFLFLTIFEEERMKKILMSAAAKMMSNVAKADCGEV